MGFTREHGFMAERHSRRLKKRDRLLDAAHHQHGAAAIPPGSAPLTQSAFDQDQIGRGVPA